MALSGLHLLLTYKCNASCRHCFLSAGPRHRGSMSESLAFQIIDTAGAMPDVNHIFLEGGEPFLFPELMCRTIERASGRGLWVGALTNGFWATDKDRATQTLAPLIEAGLDGLSISADAWHAEFVPVENVKLAVSAAADLGLAADIMVCRPGSEEPGGDAGDLGDQTGAEVYLGGVIARGRAASSDILKSEKPWQSLNRCRENLSAPGRVHIGPSGEIHLCQGLLLGRRAGRERLRDILEAYSADDHPLAALLTAGGPAELASFAIELGWVPQPRYADNCHLCYAARRWLLAKYPDYLGPPQIYDEASIKFLSAAKTLPS